MIRLIEVESPTLNAGDTIPRAAVLDLRQGERKLSTKHPFLCFLTEGATSPGPSCSCCHDSLTAVVGALNCEPRQTFLLQVALVRSFPTVIGKETKRLCLAVDNMQVDQVEADSAELAVVMGLHQEVCVRVEAAVELTIFRKRRPTNNMRNQKRMIFRNMKVNVRGSSERTSSHLLQGEVGLLLFIIGFMQLFDFYNLIINY